MGRVLSILGSTLPPTKLCHNSDKDSKVHTKFEIIQGWVEISSSRVLFVRNLLKTGSNWTGTKTYFVKLNQVFIEQIKNQIQGRVSSNNKDSISSILAIIQI